MKGILGPSAGVANYSANYNDKDRRIEERIETRVRNTFEKSDTVIPKTARPARKGGRKRILGLELEYGTHCQGEKEFDRILRDPENNPRRFLDRCEFAINGSRIYWDQEHLEAASPECWTPLQVLLADEAADHILRTTQPNTPPKELRFEKTNYAENRYKESIYLKDRQPDEFVSFGSQENYGICESIDLRPLMPFFATRSLWSGAGDIYNVDGEWKFVLSSRMANIWCEFSKLRSGHGRPLLSPVSHPDPRVQITTDSTVLHGATLLKFGITALVLRMLEEAPQLVPQITLTDNIAATHQVALSASGETEVEGRRAIEIQRAYQRALEKFALHHGVSPVENLSLDFFGYVLEQLEAGNWNNLVGILDWPTKKACLEHYRESRGLDWGAPMVRRLALDFASVRPRSVLRERIQEKIVEFVSEEEIVAASVLAPSGTRAVARSAFIRQAIAGAVDTRRAEGVRALWGKPNGENRAHPFQKPRDQPQS